MHAQQLSYMQCTLIVFLDPERHKENANCPLKHTKCQIIDLFTREVQQFSCKNRKGPVDHMCISMDADEHHRVMRRLSDHKVPLYSHGLRYGNATKKKAEILD